MAYGAGIVAARQFEAAQIVDPRPFATGSLRDVFEKFPHLGPLLPAMGYGRAQLADLEQTIARAPVDAVVVATPIDLARIIRIFPAVRSRAITTSSNARGPRWLSFFASGALFALPLAPR